MASSDGHEESFREGRERRDEGDGRLVADLSGADPADRQAPATPGTGFGDGHPGDVSGATIGDPGDGTDELSEAEDGGDDSELANVPDPAYGSRLENEGVPGTREQGSDPGPEVVYDDETRTFEGDLEPGARRPMDPDDEGRVVEDLRTDSDEAGAARRPDER